MKTWKNRNNLSENKPNMIMRRHRYLAFAIALLIAASTFFKLEVKAEDKEGKVFIQNRDYARGVLAINTDKSIYLPGERAYLQMAALREDGDTICDANLKLEIVSPSGELSSPTVQKSGKCGPNNVTDVPDYFAYYQIEGPGIYQMKLTNLDNGYEITDSFEVRDSLPFDIERIGPTRIYPPAEYQMTLRIKANQDFIGEVIDYVPDTFEIKSQIPSLKSQTNSKFISWRVGWKAGETYELKYQFDAPDISPYLYSLGPLKIGEFQEIRPWQIAADQTYPYIKVQKGEAQLGNNTTSTQVNITSVANQNNAFILLTWRGDDAGTAMDLEKVFATAKFNSNSQIQIDRGETSNNNSVANYVWQVIEADPNAPTPAFTVQTNEQAFLSTETQKNVTITDVGDTSKCVVFLQNRNGNGDDIRYHRFRGKLTSTTNLQITRAASGSTATVRWWVVKFSSDFSVYKGSTTMNAVSSTNASIGGTVNLSRSAVFITYDANTNGLGQSSVRAWLGSTTQINFDRTSATGICNIEWAVVEFPSTVSVQSDNNSSSPNTTAYSLDVTISGITQANTFSVATNKCSGTGTVFPRPQTTNYLSSTTNLQLKTGYSGNTNTWTYYVIDTSGWTYTTAAAQVYYAVGQSTSNDLRTGTPTCSVSGNTITFSTGQTDSRFGVGCKVTYGGSNVCYISGKTSSTVWSCINATGGTPTAASAGTTVNSIYHAFASLSTAVAGASGPSYLNTSNLVTGNYILNIPCYYDTGADTTVVIIDGWTTGPNNYIKVYTPNTWAECNQSQRHSGKWDSTKYNLYIAAADYDSLDIFDNNVWIDGLQIYKAGIWDGIWIDTQPSGAEIKISNTIVRGNGSNYIGINADTSMAGTVKIWNTISYNNGTHGFKLDTSGTIRCYNCTAFANLSYGFYRASYGVFIVKNCLSYNNSSANYSGTFTSSTNNLSGPSGTAPGSNPRSGVAVTFISTTPGSEDLHLEDTDTGAMDQGTSLSADADIAFSNDIDGQTRPYGTYWDIGADERQLCAFTYRKPITVQTGQVSAGPHLDFPMLISITDADLKAKANPYGTDIIFRAQDSTTCNGTPPCTLSHEIEKYDPATGQLIAWVKVPSINNGTVIYMHYGNNCVTSSTEDVNDVWSNGYKGVWHLKETSGTQQDSTQFGNNGTASVTTQGSATGKINGADGFTGTLDRVQVGTSNWSASQGTLELWGYPTATTYSRYFFGHTTQPAFNNRIQLYTDDTTGDLNLGLGDSHYRYTNIQVLTPATWYHIVLTWNGSNYIVYVDGVSKANGSYTGLSTLETFADIGNDGDTASRNEGFNGVIDEVRVSNIIRSPGWILTQYNNQGNPSAFYSVGNEETSPATAVDLLSFTARGQAGSVLVEWETAQEVNNLGFNLYRLAGTNGSFTKLNKDLIPGLISSVKGRKYSHIDRNVIRGVLYYYLLEDVDLSGKVTTHGPVCVDWDDDGIADDLEREAIDDKNDKEDKGKSGSEAEQSPADWTPSPYGESAGWVKVGSFRARQEADGVSLEWVTSFEADNLGFNIYREQDGKYYRVTADLVPGSVFNAGARRELVGGQRYVYFDALSERTGQESYWLDCVGLDGARASFGPIKAEIGGKPIPERLKARYRSIARHQVSREEKLERIVELRKELKTKETEMRAPQAVFSSQTSISSVVPKKLSEPRLPPSEAQWVLAAKPAVKISVKEEGWYRIGQPELVAAGLDPLVDPRYLQLYVDGAEQSMMVTGSNDGRFDPEDAVEFYGKGLDTPYTETRVYWLVVGSRPGRRLDTPFTDIRSALDIKMLLSRGLRGRGASLSFPYSVELKERTFYFAALKNGEEESFFGSLIYQEPVDQLINAPHPDPSAPDNAKLEVVLQGATDSSHRVKILFNNQETSLFAFSGQNRGTIEIEIPHRLILEGENIVTLEAQGGLMDASLVDYIRLTYWRTYTADEDSLKFTAMGTEWISIGGFSSAEIRVVDITDPAQMFNVSGRVQPEGSGYAITFKVPGHGQRTLLAFTEEKIKEPAGVAANTASSWHERTQGADFVIISSPDFLEGVKPLKELREQPGFAVALVNAEDIYDEFNFGSKSPWTLREFLSRAHDRWLPAPRFVLLVGDASYDSRNYLGFGDFDFVPTKYVDTEYIKTASDDWFVDFDDDGLPNMAVGRLPVDSAAEAEAIVSKIISYENESAAGFMNEVLLVADANDGQYDFEAASAQVAAVLPQGMTVRQILRGQNPEARNELLSSLNQGQLLVNYVGHGSTEIWKGNLLTSSDAWDLTNSPSLPFLVSMTCLNGFFYDPYSESMAETFLKVKGGGAVAVWASSGLTFPPEQILMNRRLIQLLFNGKGLTIGEAVALSKQAFMDMDVRKTWILFGDPTTKLR